MVWTVWAPGRTAIGHLLFLFFSSGVAGDGTQGLASYH